MIGARFPSTRASLSMRRPPLVPRVPGHCWMAPNGGPVIGLRFTVSGPVSTEVWPGSPQSGSSPFSAYWLYRSTVASSVSGSMPILPASSLIDPASWTQSGASWPSGPVRVIEMPGLAPEMPCSRMAAPKMFQAGALLVNPGLRWSKKPNGAEKSL